MINKSMLHNYHQQHNADFIELENDCFVVGQYNNLEQEKQQYTNLALIDLTTLTRIGFKGNDTPAWLMQQKIKLPEKPNSAIRLADGTLLAKLSFNEYLFLNNLNNNSSSCKTLENSWKMENDKLCYKLHRNHSHSYFLLTGKHSIMLMSKICGVDLADLHFPTHSVAQTSVARLNTIIIKDNIADTTVFHLLFDSASAEYMWHCLLDAMQEFSGKIIGVNSLINSKK